MLSVGYIGLGIMGKPMAHNVLKAGFPLVVHNRSQAAVEELCREGAIPAHSPEEVAKQVDVIFTNLPDSPDVEVVALGRYGIIEGGHEGLIYVDNSTIKPSVSRKIAQMMKSKDVACLDAPVSGGQIGAQEGTLSIMVGGPEKALKKILPILNVIGKKITYVGGNGAGQIAKVANQIMVAAQMVALGELLILSQKSGVDAKKVIEAIRGGAAQCWTLDHKPTRLFAGNRQPGFKAALQAKDLNIVIETAREYDVPLPMTAVNTQLFHSMIAMGMGELDNSAVISVIEHLASTQLNTN